MLADPTYKPREVFSMNSRKVKHRYGWMKVKGLKVGFLNTSEKKKKIRQRDGTSERELSITTEYSSVCPIYCIYVHLVQRDSVAFLV